MRYIPTVEANGWVTKTTSEKGNKGIHCQRKFKEGVLMLERAIYTWDSPVLVSIVLTGSDIDTYNLFIHKLKRRLSDSSIMFEYKGCTESDKHKGQHQHFGWVVEADSFDNIFDSDDSAVSLTVASVQHQEPTFNVFVCNPQRYSTPFIPLTDDTLQDAACYISYLYKQRSKMPGHKYMSSRTARTLH